VCRGMQLLNVHFGGRLVRNLDEVCERRNSHVASNHEIEIVDAGWRKRLKTKAVRTNSFHRQGVTLSTLSSQLRPFAVDANGIVEGLYHPDLPITGIQWHPERSNSASEVDDIVLRSWLTRERIACT
jgi:putative glutamine amidotransferase